jgi:hypothetical protein
MEGNIICPDGWATDPVMGVGCNTPKLAAVIIGVFMFALCAFSACQNCRLLWYWWKMKLHMLPLFYCYAACGAANVLFMAHIIIMCIIGQVDKPFTATATASLFLTCMLWGIGVGVFAPLNFLDQTAETAHSFDIHAVDRWQWRARFMFAPLALLGIVVGFSAAIVLLCSAELEKREQGAVVVWLVTMVIQLILGGTAAFSKRQLLDIRGKLGAATAAKLDTDLRVSHSIMMTSGLKAIVCTCFAAIEPARHITGAALLFFYLPFVIVHQCHMASTRWISKSAPTLDLSKSAPTLDLTLLSTAIANRSQQIREQANSPKPKVPVAQAGVSLALLRQVAAEHGIDGSNDLTMDELCNRHIKPRTKDIGGKGSGAFVELLSGGSSTDGLGRAWCGRPSYMLSYSWGYSVRLILEVLSDFEADHPLAESTDRADCYYYFVDQFAIDQHNFGGVSTGDIPETETEVQRMMMATLDESIRLPGKMIMVLDPWADPVVLRRVWCLFEVYRAIELNADVLMCFSRREAKRFYQKLSAKPRQVSGKDALVPTIDAARAEASVEKDRLLIHSIIADTIGYEAFNSKVQAFMETALRHAALQGAVRSRAPLSRATSFVATPSRTPAPNEPRVLGFG